jgi:hypothetical protein
MTLVHAIAKALAGAEILRQKATVPYTPNAEVALLIEQCKAIEHVCAVARQHLQPEPAGRIAEAMLNPCAQTNAWTARRLLKQTHGKNGVEALPVVPEEPKS